MEYSPNEGFDIAVSRNIHMESTANADYLVKAANNILKELALYIREEIFEEIRFKYFPELPSRKTCIWVFEKQSAKYWNDTLKDGFEFYKLELTGILHKADQKYLHAEIISHEELKRRAFNYWTGCDGEKPIEQELLFEGIVNIKERYENIDDLMKNNP